jgi:hypothetical protein
MKDLLKTVFGGLFGQKDNTAQIYQALVLEERRQMNAILTYFLAAVVIGFAIYNLKK